MSRLDFLGKFAFSLSKKLFLPDYLDRLDGVFGFEHHRKIIKKSGTIIEKINQFSFHNGITNAGKNYLLNVAFKGSPSPIATWYMSLIDDAGFTGLSAADTMASTGWEEFQNYSQSARVAWGPATATAQLLTNPSLCVFDISVTGDLNGALIVSDSAKGSTTGTLWTTGSFPSPVHVTGGTDQIRLTYNLSA